LASTSVMNCAISNDSKWIVTAGGDKTLKIYSVEGKQRLTSNGHKEYVNDCHINNDGKWCLSAGGILKIWDMDTGICKAILTETEPNKCTKDIRACCISPDQKWIASCGDTKVVKIWDIQSGICVRTLNGHEKMIMTCVFSPDGKWIASGGLDNIIKIWEFQTGNCEATLKGHTKSVQHCNFSNDCKKIVTCAMDNSIKIWDFDSKKEITTIQDNSWVLKCFFYSKW